MGRLLFLTLLSVAAFAQEPAEQRYLSSMGTESSVISSGTVWLYSYSWYGVQKIKLAQIEDGRAQLPVDTERVKHELNPHPNTEVYVLVIQIGEHLWYWTPNISPAVISTDLMGLL